MLNDISLEQKHYFWFPVELYSTLGKKKKEKKNLKLFEHGMQNFRSSLVNHISDVDAVLGELKKSLWKSKWNSRI